jgi:hypothetical protein
MSTPENGVIERTVEALRRRGFHADYVDTGDLAVARIVELVPPGAAVGIGDSTTLQQLGAIAALESRGHPVVNPFDKKMLPSKGNPADLELLLRESLRRDVFLTGANAVTECGCIVSVDGAGNRVAGMVFGAPRVILAIGRNKIVRDLEAAFARLKKVICPRHAANRGFRTPCALNGECSDCRSPERICNAITILQGKPMRTDTWVVLIGEDLGLGWDPEWPPERIERVWRNYVAHCWRPNLH